MKHEAKPLLSIVLCLVVFAATSLAQPQPDKSNRAAWESFSAGIALLEKGAPRSDVLAQWETTMKEYPRSEYRHQLLSYTTILRAQIEQESTIPAEGEQPGKLSPTQQVAYYIAHFPDVHGQQMGQPGICSVFSNGDDTKASDAVVKIGRPAVPQLIKALDDRRLTRSIGYWRNFDPHRTVLRVQDVALQCIQAILNMRFLPSDLSYLSTAQPQLHSNITADIETWWKQNGQKTPLQGYLARLRQFEKAKAPVWQRVEMLEKIESLDKTAVNSTAFLQSWAIEVKGNRDYLPVIAKKLALRGDKSWVPAMQRIVGENERYIPDEAIWCVVKLGNAEDYRLLRQRVRSDIKAGKSMGTSAYLVPVIKALSGTDNTLAVPLLVEIVQHRQSIGGRDDPGKGYVPEFGSHTASMLDLIRLTSHSAGFDAHASQTARFAAIDSWLAWWNQQGRVAYLKKHPEAA